MIETILSIKICLLLVFLIGLLTGFFYVRRLIKEDYLPIINKYKKTILNNTNSIKEYEQKINSHNKEISTLREEIKSYKNEVSIVEEDLLNVEYNYSKRSNIIDKKRLEIEDNEKILNSLKKEYQFLKDKIEKKDKIISENKLNHDEINKLISQIEKDENSLNQLNDDIEILKDLTKKIQEEINTHKQNIIKNSSELEKKEYELEKNQKLKLTVELDNLNKQLQEYKNKLLELKNAN
jgi:chromosome segregation ATPase